jgi:hypothetical protein
LLNHKVAEVEEIGADAQNVWCVGNLKHKSKKIKRKLLVMLISIGQ